MVVVLGPESGQAPSELFEKAQVPAGFTGERGQLIEVLKAQVEDLRGDRDGWRQQAEASQRLLTHVQQVPEPALRPWWKRLAG